MFIRTLRDEVNIKELVEKASAKFQAKFQLFWMVFGLVQSDLEPNWYALSPFLRAAASIGLEARARLWSQC